MPNQSQAVIPRYSSRELDALKQTGNQIYNHIQGAIGRINDLISDTESLKTSVPLADYVINDLLVDLQTANDSLSDATGSAMLIVEEAGQ